MCGVVVAQAQTTGYCVEKVFGPVLDTIGDDIEDTSQIWVAVDEAAVEGILADLRCV